VDSLRLPARLELLDEFRAFVAARAREWNMPEDLDLKIELVLEEALVNVMRYAYPDGNGQVEVVCAEERFPAPGKRRFLIEIRDWGPAFNPLERPVPDLAAGISERPIGGLGIHLIRTMAEEVAYARTDGANILSIRFHLPDPAV
jgi:anti-sigma regulatory factor (Ser/Thr protein kinase)